MSRASIPATLHVSENGSSEIHGLYQDWSADVEFNGRHVQFLFTRSRDDIDAKVVFQTAGLREPGAEWKVIDRRTGKEEGDDVSSIGRALAAVGRAEADILARRKQADES